MCDSLRSNSLQAQAKNISAHVPARPWAVVFSYMSRDATTETSMTLDIQVQHESPVTFSKKTKDRAEVFCEPLTSKESYMNISVNKLPL